MNLPKWVIPWSHISLGRINLRVSNKPKLWLVTLFLPLQVVLVNAFRLWKPNVSLAIGNLKSRCLPSIFDWIMEFAIQIHTHTAMPVPSENRTGGMHPITFTSGHLPDNFIWWHFRTVGWLGYVNVALLVKHVNVVLPQSSCWCSSITNWGLMNRGHKKIFVCSLSCYNLFPELSEMWVPLPSTQ